MAKVPIIDVDDDSSISSAPSSSLVSEDVFDEQMFFILKSFMVSKSGKNVADCMEEISEKLATLCSLVSTLSTQKST